MSSSAVPLELSRDTKVWRISRSTQPAPRPAVWIILLNSTAHVVMVKWRANGRSKDKVVILPDCPGQQEAAGEKPPGGCTGVFAAHRGGIAVASAAQRLDEELEPTTRGVLQSSGPRAPLAPGCSQRNGSIQVWCVVSGDA
jgi:hypothetical protein